ncbi:MAG TPA: hypothetical protein VGD84_23230, partial [Pseudonocardiaceae bacterium]
IMSQLPLDSVATGQLGAIQQLQFVTQALGGIPSFTAAGTFGGSNAQGTWTAGSADGTSWGAATVHSPLGIVGESLGGDLQHGVTAALSSASPAGEMHAGTVIPGLPAIPGLPSLGGLPSLPGLPSLGGLPSGFSALSDVTDALDGHVSSMTDNATNTANMVAGVADFAVGGLSNSAQLTDALAHPATAIQALTSTAESVVTSGANMLPAPASTVAGGAMHSVDSATHGMVDQVTSQLPTSALSGVTSHLPALDPSHTLGMVQGVVGNVTGNITSHLPSGVLPTGALGDLGHLDTSAATHALSTVTGVVGDVTSHSPVADVTGAGGLLGSVGHTDVGSELSHVTSDLHLPGLF